MHDPVADYVHRTSQTLGTAELKEQQRIYALDRYAATAQRLVDHKLSQKPTLIITGEGPISFAHLNRHNIIWLKEHVSNIQFIEGGSYPDIFKTNAYRLECGMGLPEHCLVRTMLDTLVARRQMGKLDWVDFQAWNRPWIEENIDRIIFTPLVSYEGVGPQRVMKTYTTLEEMIHSPPYALKYPLGDEFHNYILGKYRGIKKEEPVHLAIQLVIKPLMYAYTFTTVLKSSMVVWSTSEKGKMYLWNGKEYYMHRQIGQPEGFPLLTIPDEVEDMVYEYEAQEAKKLMSRVGYKDTGVYSHFRWESALYSYTCHSTIAKTLIPLLSGTILSVCDGVGLVDGAFCIDTEPSPYAINHVERGTLKDVISKWTTETLLIMYGACFLDEEDWRTINSTTASCIIVDMQSIPFKGAREYTRGIMVRVTEASHFRMPPSIDVYKYHDPPYTRNLLEQKKIYYIVSEGNALFFLQRMNPNLVYACDENMKSFLEAKGLRVCVEPFNKKKHVRLLETFDSWKIFKKGYFVPAGMEDPPVTTVHRPQTVYMTRVVYHLATMKMILFAQELGISLMVGSTPRIAHFIFPRVCTTSTFTVLEGVDYVLHRPTIYEFNGRVTVQGSIGSIISLNSTDRKQFECDMVEIKLSFNRNDYARIIMVLENCANANVRQWVKDYG